MTTESLKNNFNNFKAIAGITFVILLFITCIKLLATENDTIQIFERRIPMKQF